MVSKKALYFLLGGIPLIIISILFSRELTFFVIYNVAICGIIIGDYFITPKKSSIAVGREVKNKILFSRNNIVVLTLYNSSKYNLKLKVKDCFDKRLNNGASDFEKTLSVSSDCEEKLEYALVPYKRGKFNMYEVYIEVSGILGFCKKIYKYKLEDEIKVFPDITPAYKFRILVSRQSEDSKRHLKARTTGTQIENLREYVDGDEYRKINWSATSRTNKLIVNEYDVEKNQNIFITLDSGRTMSTIYDTTTLMDWAVSNAVILGDIATFNKDKVGFMSFNDEVNNFFVPGFAGVNKILNSIYDTYSVEKSSDYKKAFVYFSKMVKKRSLICIFTNFNNEAEVANLMSGLELVLAKHKVMIVIVEDPRLRQNKDLDIKVTKNAYDKVASEHILFEKQKLIDKLKKKGVAVVCAPPDEVGYKSIVTYLDLKTSI